MMALTAFIIQPPQHMILAVITTGDSYPAPTLKVNRGDTLRITLLNELEGQAFEALQIPATPIYVDGVLFNHQI